MTRNGNRKYDVMTPFRIEKAMLSRIDGLVELTGRSRSAISRDCLQIGLDCMEDEYEDTDDRFKHDDDEEE